MTKKILLFGANGQVGREVAIVAEGLDISLVPLLRADADLAIAGAAASAIAREKPDVVINAAAWTAVDKAETEIEAARRLNSQAPAEIAAAASQAGARFVHLSTDYVFDGDGHHPIAEDAPTAPLNVYGATKLDGERLALAAYPEAVVIRTSWVFSAYSANFVKTMLRLSDTRSALDIVADQMGGPTPAQAIAEACLTIGLAENGRGGVYHFQGAPVASWADFAEAIFAAATRPVAVRRIDTRNYPTPARRPLFTVLDCGKIKRDYGIDQPDWRAALGDCVRTLTRG
jgi:dTDP-4-dehydrorhamnose reductase